MNAENRFFRSEFRKHSEYLENSQLQKLLTKKNFYKKM